MTDVTSDKTPVPARPAKDILPEGHVRARVLPRGHDKIFTGEMNPSSLVDRFPTHKRGDVVTLPLEIAVAQEEAGLMEII